MITGKFKYIILGLVGIVLVIVALVVYRMFFLFNRDKVKGYAEAAANGTAGPDAAYKLIIEGVQHILKSQDLTKQVLIIAELTRTEKEFALVDAALNNCYASGLIENPATITETITKGE